MALKQERDEKRKRDEEERKERARIKKEKAEAALKEKRGSVQGINTGKLIFIVIGFDRERSKAFFFIRY